MTTLKHAKATLRDLGMSITKRDGEYRVAFFGALTEVEPSAYYTNDIDDALATGVAMSVRRKCHAV